MHAEFPGNEIIAKVLPAFYRKYDLDADGGLNDSTVKIVVYKRFYFYLPNIDDRKKAVLKHDIHHIITGYKSDFKGETEIGAWEIASGCKKYWVATALDLSGMAWGCLFNLSGVFRAFIRGKRTQNLYADNIPDKEALAMTIDELRAKLELDVTQQKPASFAEVISFFLWNVAGAVYSVLSALLIPPLMIYSLIVAWKKRSA